MSGQSNSKMHGALLSVRDAADALSVSERTVRRMIATGELSVVRLGRSVRIRQLDLDALIGRQLHAGGR
jgi:excisionase family DNA binding protein